MSTQLDLNLIASSQDGAAKETRWREIVADWMTTGADCSVRSFASLARALPAGFCLRTSLECSPSTSAETSVPASGRWGNSGMLWDGVCLTLNTSEFDSGASACSLSDVLETQDVPQKYYLSPKACAGILRRAAKRGKVLPAILDRALRNA